MLEEHPKRVGVPCETIGLMENHMRAVGVSVESGWSTIVGYESTVICAGAPEQSGRHTPWQLIRTVHCGFSKGKITTWINK